MFLCPLDLAAQNGIKYLHRIFRCRQISTVTQLNNRNRMQHSVV